MLQSSFFDVEDRFNKLNDRDSLVSLSSLIDWKLFRDTLSKVREKKRKSAAGRKPYDVVLMFKMLILQHLYNLSDDEVECQIRGRLSFCRFLSIKPEQRIPDAKPICLFREQLVKLDLMKALFLDFDMLLTEAGLTARKGQIIGASFVEVPRQRSSLDENKQIKNGETPERFEKNQAIKAQKDCDARWAKKNQEMHYGYKNHVSVDNAHKFIREYEVTSAEVHDSQKFIDVLSENTCKDVYADNTYGEEEGGMILKMPGMTPKIIKKAKKNKLLSARDKAANKKKSKMRARVERVFGSITNEQGGMYSRVVGLSGTKVKIGMVNLTYNIRRFVSLHKTNPSLVG